MFSLFLMQNNAVKYKNHHTKLGEIEFDGIDEYAIYGFFRNPLDRFLSSLRFMRQFLTYDKSLLDDFGVSAEQFRKLDCEQIFNFTIKNKATFDFFLTRKSNG